MKSKGYFLIDALFIVIMVMIISLLTLSLMRLSDNYDDVKKRVKEMQVLINEEYINMGFNICIDQDLS